MKFVLLLPMRAMKHYVTWIDDGDLPEVGRVVERAGFDAVALTDHPYPDKQWLGSGGHHSLDPFVGLAAMGAATTSLRLMTYVLVAGYRNPYLTAKSLATLDTVTRGRVIAGIAAGYLRPEFEVLGADFAGRGPRFDAALTAMRAAWNGEDHDSAFFPAHGHEMAPPPAQPGGPPVWIGGNSRAARRRAIEHGDGWMPMGQSRKAAEVTGSPPIESVEDLAEVVGEVVDRRRESGRPPLDVAFNPFEKPHPREWDAQAFGEAVRDRLGDYERAGVSWLAIEPASRSLASFREDVDTLGRVLVSEPAG